jgi:hypothetical protein
MNRLKTQHFTPVTRLGQLLWIHDVPVIVNIFTIYKQTRHYVVKLTSFFIVKKSLT